MLDGKLLKPLLLDVGELSTGLTDIFAIQASETNDSGKWNIHVNFHSKFHLFGNFFPSDIFRPKLCKRFPN